MAHTDCTVPRVEYSALSLIYLAERAVLYSPQLTHDSLYSTSLPGAPCTVLSYTPAMYVLTIQALSPIPTNRMYSQEGACVRRRGEREWIADWK